MEPGPRGEREPCREGPPGSPRRQGPVDRSRVQQDEGEFERPFIEGRTRRPNQKAKSEGRIRRPNRLQFADGAGTSSSVILAAGPPSNLKRMAAAWIADQLDCRSPWLATEPESTCRQCPEAVNTLTL